MQLQESIVYLNKVITRLVARVKLAERIAMVTEAYTYVYTHRNYTRIQLVIKLFGHLNIHFTFKTIKSDGIR